jgi:UDPglucose 6-dehydrogenase
VGLGKLGLPVALTLADAGHEVMGWDASEERRHQIVYREVPEVEYEDGLADLMHRHEVPLLPIDRLVEDLNPEVILVCVQTPHASEFEGTTPLESDPEDFDYSHLRAAVAEIGVAVDGCDADPLVVIVSTCLPGTFDREIRSLQYDLRMAYHPLFIAMGSVIEDFKAPEFVLVGSDYEEMPVELVRLYEDFYDLCGPGVAAFLRHMSITSAELTKVAYNAAIGFKLLLANTVAELSDKVGANCDDVMDTLKLARKRLVSTAYMTPGMGDGGGCHPRDQIALSWLAAEYELSADSFLFIVQAREEHARWLAGEWAAHAVKYDLPMVMLGEAYKANTPLKTGSHAALVAHYAREDGHDILATDGPLADYPRACYFLATPHHHFLGAPLAAGSVLVDPWGAYANDPFARDHGSPGLEVVQPGRRA